MRFGICTAPNALGDPARLLDLLAKAGADYVEWAVGSVMASEAEFEKLLGVVAQAPLKPEAFCVFLPPHHRITGPSVNLEAVLAYASEAMRRVAALGGEIIVLGSGSARKVPAGFSMEEATRQFVEFASALGPRAAENGITITIEPLNSHEDNLITSVTRGAELVQAVKHPNIRLLADFYHMNEEGEPASAIIEAGGDKIRHTHLADLGRVAPGFAANGEADFHAFFGALRQVGYDARCSFEGKTEDFARQVKPLLSHMKQRYEETVA